MSTMKFDEWENSNAEPVITADDARILFGG